MEKPSLEALDRCYSLSRNIKREPESCEKARGSLPSLQPALPEQTLRKVLTRAAAATRSQLDASSSPAGRPQPPAPLTASQPRSAGTGARRTRLPAQRRPGRKPRRRPGEQSAPRLPPHASRIRPAERSLGPRSRRPPAAGPAPRRPPSRQAAGPAPRPLPSASSRARRPAGPPARPPRRGLRGGPAAVGTQRRSRPALLGGASAPGPPPPAPGLPGAPRLPAPPRRRLEGGKAYAGALAPGAAAPPARGCPPGTHRSGACAAQLGPKQRRQMARAPPSPHGRRRDPGNTRGFPELFPGPTASPTQDLALRTSSRQRL